MRARISTKTIAAFLLATLNVFIISASSALSSSEEMESAGLVVYGSSGNIVVTANNIIGTNNFSIGFQLDGPDIREWRDRSALRSLAQEAKFKLVRFFEHRLGKACTRWSDETRTGTWNWDAIDSLVSRILEIGAEPLIVLGFYSWTEYRLTSTPQGMADDPETGLPYPESWAAYCKEWVKHFREEGLPVRYYEMINEASFYFGWPAVQPELGYYMELYNSASIAMKEENPDVKLGCDSSTFKKVLDYFITDGEPLDFISFHRYGLSSASQSESEAFTAAETKYLSESGNLWSPEQAVEQYYSRKGKKLPIIMSEGNLCDDYDPIDSRTHTLVGAVYTALSLRTFVLKGFLHSIYFHFSGGLEDMGMVDENTNEPFYPYYVQQMLGQHLAIGDKLVESSSSSSNMRSLAWINEDRVVVLLISKTTQTQSVRLQGVGEQMDYYKIDNTISWETPAVQQGTISYTDALTVNGYSVVLLVSTA